jgi:hypothetical protein
MSLIHQLRSQVYTDFFSCVLSEWLREQERASQSADGSLIEIRFGWQPKPSRRGDRYYSLPQISHSLCGTSRTEQSTRPAVAPYLLRV